MGTADKIQSISPHKQLMADSTGLFDGDSEVRYQQEEESTKRNNVVHQLASDGSNGTQQVQCIIPSSLTSCFGCLLPVLWSRS